MQRGGWLAREDLDDPELWTPLVHARCLSDAVQKVEDPIEVSHKIPIESRTRSPKIKLESLYMPTAPFCESPLANDDPDKAINPKCLLEWEVPGICVAWLQSLSVQRQNNNSRLRVEGLGFSSAAIW